MQINTDDGKTFTLVRETDADQQLLDALDSIRSAHVVHTERVRNGSGYETRAVYVVIDHSSQPALTAQSGRQALSALGQLFSLGLSKSANNGHVSTTPTNPQPQEQLSACLVKLEMMMNTLRDVVLKQEVMLQKVCSTHSESKVVEKAIVSEGAAA